MSKELEKLMKKLDEGKKKDEEAGIKPKKQVGRPPKIVEPVAVPEEDLEEEEEDDEDEEEEEITEESEVTPMKPIEIPKIKLEPSEEEQTLKKEQEIAILQNSGIFRAEVLYQLQGLNNNLLVLNKILSRLIENDK